MTPTMPGRRVLAGASLLVGALLAPLPVAEAGQVKGSLRVSVTVVASCTASPTGSTCKPNGSSRKASAAAQAAPKIATQEARVVIERDTVTIIY